MSQEEILRFGESIGQGRLHLESPLSLLQGKRPRDILKEPLPDTGFAERLIIKLGTLLSRDLLVDITGLHHITAMKDPFILAANHNQRLEALVVPIWLAYIRGGDPIRFLADWNFLLIPGIATLLRRGKTIPVALKPARPKFLNVLKPHIVSSPNGFHAAKKVLEDGQSIGLFPEGTVNPDPTMLLRGHIGAARLSLQTGAPLVPMGINFPYHDRTKRIPEFAKMSITIGSPVRPPDAVSREHYDASYEQTLHAILMQNIAELSGKHWNPLSKRRTHYVH